MGDIGGHRGAFKGSVGGAFMGVIGVGAFKGSIGGAFMGYIGVPLRDL